MFLLAGVGRSLDRDPPLHAGRNRPFRSAGHAVCAFARNPAALQPAPGLEVVRCPQAHQRLFSRHAEPDCGPEGRRRSPPHRPELVRCRGQPTRRRVTRARVLRPSCEGPIRSCRSKRSVRAASTTPSSARPDLGALWTRWPNQAMIIALRRSAQQHKLRVVEFDRHVWTLAFREPAE